MTKKQLISELIALEERIEMGMLVQSEARNQIRNLYLDINEVFPEGSDSSMECYEYLTEANNTALDMYGVEYL